MADEEEELLQLAIQQSLMEQQGGGRVEMEQQGGGRVEMGEGGIGGGNLRAVEVSTMALKDGSEATMSCVYVYAFYITVYTCF